MANVARRRFSQAVPRLYARKLSPGRQIPLRRPAPPPSHSFPPDRPLPPDRAILPLQCAHWNYDGHSCQNTATQVCAKCKLVAYCGDDCQKAHWCDHQRQCECALSKESWIPAWDREQRNPSWMGKEDLNGAKNLWGITPAIDVLRLEQNEGVDYDKEISALFAASGDLRNVVMTISKLPKAFQQHVHMAINDHDFDVVARNIIVLLIALDSERVVNGQDAGPISDVVEAMIHVWYSALLPEKVYSRLQTRIKPWIDQACQDIDDRDKTDPNACMSYTWRVEPGRALRLSLEQRFWQRLASYLDVPAGLTKEDARRIRHNVTLHIKWTDYRDRSYFRHRSPFLRVAKRRFSEDGLLLPFGHPRLGFDVPNPIWRMPFNADPAAGWSLSALRETPWLAPYDWYGKLFMHLSTVLNKFLARLRNTSITFDMFHENVWVLSRHLQTNGLGFSRIEAAGICDVGEIGIHKTTLLLAPYLESPQHNRHATLITLFRDATKQMMKRRMPDTETKHPELIFRYIPEPKYPTIPRYGAEMTRMSDARCLVEDVDAIFERFTELCGFGTICTVTGLKVKRKHTVTDKWPTRSKLKPGSDAEVEESRYILGSPFSALERYVEWRWRRIDPTEV